MYLFVSDDIILYRVPIWIITYWYASKLYTVCPNRSNYYLVDKYLDFKLSLDFLPLKWTHITNFVYYLYSFLLGVVSPVQSSVEMKNRGSFAGSACYIIIQSSNKSLFVRQSVYVTWNDFALLSLILQSFVHWLMLFTAIWCFLFAFHVLRW